MQSEITAEWLLLFFMPNQFDTRNTQDQCITDLESVRDQFDALLFMNKDSNFSER